MSAKGSLRFCFVGIVFVCTLLIPNVLHAQLVVNQGSALPSGWTADSLIRNVLLGEGVEVSNCRFNGSTGIISCDAIGKFTTGNNPTNLNIVSGIVMATGSVLEAIGPNNNTSQSMASNCTSYSYPPAGTTNAVWTSMLGNRTANDIAVLEFDFVPKSDSVKFNYVFASEEYPEFVCSEYNDVFGFFLYGVNPSGGMYNNVNIALVPNSTTPIAINYVNGGVSAGSSSDCILTNSQYYVNNTNGSTIQYDGFTTLLTAQAKVIPCTQYHLTMVIADISDGAYDSGVFLEAGSLSSNPITATYSNAANPQYPSQIYEGCCARVVLHRPHALSTQTQIGISLEGTAIPGQDYDDMNPYIFFPAGQDTMSFSVCPTKDWITEGEETVKIVMSPTTGCARSDSVEFSIVDTDTLSIRIEHDSLTSFMSQVQLRTVIEGGMPNRTVLWREMRTGQQRTGETITVQTQPDSRWSATVEDFCFNYASDTVDIGIRRFFAFLPSDTVICQGEPFLIRVTLNDTCPDSCVWTANNIMGTLESGPDSLLVSPRVTTKYYVRTYMRWNNQWWEDYDSVNVVVVPSPNLQATANPERLCVGETVNISATGVANYSWDGGVTYTTATSHTYVPDSTCYYIIYGKTNTAECFGRDTVWVTVDTMPDITLSSGTGVCDGEEVQLTAQTSSQSYHWSSSPTDPALSGQEGNKTIVVNPMVTTIYTFTATNATCTDYDSVIVAVEPSPVAIGEVLPRTVSLGAMEAEFVDHSLNSTTRRWVFPDGTERNEASFKYVVPNEVDSVSLLLWAYNPYQCFDTTRVTVFVDHTTLWTPNAFTPDESTNNTFLVKMNDVQMYHIFIYDRLGRLVFESKDPEQPWDGTLQNGQKCPQGTYVYLISYHKITYPFDQVLQKGTVVLIR